jgi:HEAT repeat protein
METKVGNLIIFVFVSVILVSMSIQASETSFRLSEKVIKQAKEIAKKESSTDLSKRRPEGLSKLDSETDIKKVIEESMKELGDDKREVQENGLRKLRYLGKLAFSDIVKGLESENKNVRQWCVSLLSNRGSEAVPYLSKVLRSELDKIIRASSASDLGQTYDTNAVPALLDALDDSDYFVQISAARALAYIKDKRAIEPLKKLIENTVVNGQVRNAAAEAIFRIDKEKGSKVIQDAIAKEKNEFVRQNFNAVLQSTGGYAYWPPDLLEIHQLVKDADTLAGESYSEKEIKRLLDYIDSSYWAVSSGCINALAKLNAGKTVPEIIARGSISSTFYSCLAQIASPEAVDYIVECIQSKDQALRERTIEGMGYGGKWAVPILVELLNDTSLRRIHKSGILPAIDAFNGNWPDSHRAYDALFLCLSNQGLRGTSINLASGARLDIDEEIQRFKKWWNDYGEDFLQNKNVPNPNMKMAFLAT